MARQGDGSFVGSTDKHASLGPAMKLWRFLLDHWAYGILPLIYGPLVAAIVIDLVQSRGNIVKVLGDIKYALDHAPGPD